MVTATIILPERFQLVNASSPLLAGLSILPLAAATGLGSFVGGAISSARNLTSPALMAGSSLQLLALGLLTTIPDTLSIPHYIYGVQVVLGFGIGMCLSAGTLMVTLNSEQGEIAATQGATAQLRPLGGFIGLTIATALFNARSEAALGSFLSAEQMKVLHRSPLGALAFEPDVLAMVRAVYARVFRVQMRALVVVAVLGVLVSCASWERNAVGMERMKVHLGVGTEAEGVTEVEGAKEERKEGV